MAPPGHNAVAASARECREADLGGCLCSGPGRGGLVDGGEAGGGGVKELGSMCSVREGHRHGVA